MSQAALRVEDDGTVFVMPKQAPDPEGLAAALACFADRVLTSETALRYRLRAASVWRGRRQGLSLEHMVETLESHSGRALPERVRADLTRWSQQIERLWLEVDQGRLVLGSANPLAITAVVRHQTLSRFVVEPLGATRAELRAEAYPALIATFDACRYPVLDHVPSGWTPVGTTPGGDARPGVARGRGRHAGVASPARVAPLRCQAMTRKGRRCQNRVRPPTAYCRVHAGRVAQAAPIDAAAFSSLVLRAYRRVLEEAGGLSDERVARLRVSVVMWVGFSTWLLAHLLSAGFTYAWGSAPAGWLVSGLALVLSCGVLGRLAAGMGVVSSLSFVGLNLLSLGLDCLHKEGLILNLCYVGIPVLLPLWGLSRLELAWSWVFLCYPVGMVVGWLVYTFLDAMST